MITLTREEAQQLLEVFELFLEDAEDVTTLENNLVKMLRTRLAQPEPEPAVWKELTTAECKMLWRISEGPRNFAEMLQAKLREKNG
jgi:hypothetical protein